MPRIAHDPGDGPDFGRILCIARNIEHTKWDVLIDQRHSVKSVELPTVFKLLARNKEKELGLDK